MKIVKTSKTVSLPCFLLRSTQQLSVSLPRLSVMAGGDVLASVSSSLPVERPKYHLVIVSQSVFISVFALSALLNVQKYFVTERYLKDRVISSSSSSSSSATVAASTSSTSVQWHHQKCRNQLSGCCPFFWIYKHLKTLFLQNDFQYFYRCSFLVSNLFKIH